MSLNSFIHNELDFIGAGEEVHQFFEELYNVFDSQGHSGSSASFVISGLSREDLYSAELLSDSLLLPFQKVLHLYSKDFAIKYLPLFATAINFNPLTPLTGEDSEWNKVSENTFQNRRCSSVFKENDRAYYHYGYIFNELSSSGATYIGYTNYHSRVDITFPFNPEGVTKNLYFLGLNREIQIKDEEQAKSYLNLYRSKEWAGYLEETLIEPKSFFINKKDNDEFIQIVTELFKMFDEFNADIKEKIIQKNVYLGIYDDESQVSENTLTLHNDRTFKFPVRFTLPLKRIIAVIPNDVTVKEGNFYTFRNSELSLTFHEIKKPTKYFQNWTEYNSELNAFTLHWGIDKKPDPFYIDKLGYELRLVGNDNYLYQMRRRFDLRHPKFEKNHSTSHVSLDDPIDCDQA